MSKTPSAVPARIKIPAALWEGVNRLGMSPAELIARSRLPFRLLRDDSPVSTAQFFDLWRCMVEIKGDPTVGLSLACALDGSVMPPSFLAAYHARNFRDGLLRVARFKRLCTPEELLITELDDRCELTL
uniref:AraC family transcriptional regulator ligand-binding domain-containing protein n=1 Tax=Pseudomonas sp. N8 TaxID=3449428 RepID=UPI003F69A278